MPRLIEQMQGTQPIRVPERKCETCGEPMAIEYRGEPNQPEEIIYFCINREKECPQYHLAQ